MTETAGRGEVSGRVTYVESGDPAVGLRILAFDADLLFDDPLGKATTDEAGWYEVTYDPDEYRDLVERAPDVYLEVRDEDDTVLADTRDATVRNVTDSEEIHVQVPGSGAESEPEPAGPTVDVGGLQVDRERFEELNSGMAIRMADAREWDEEVAKALEALHPSLAPEVLERKLCEAPLSRFLDDAVRIKEWDREVRLELEAARVGYDPNAGYTTHGCNNFDIKYKTSGSSAPDQDDSGSDIVEPGTGNVVATTTANNGVPDYVETVCYWLENALSTYTNPPFDLRNPASSGNITVEITNSTSNGRATGGKILLNPSLNDDLVAAVPTHELMHLIQYEYESNGTSGGWHGGILEGGATLGEDVVFDSHNRWVVEASESDGTLDNPDRSLKNFNQGPWEYNLSLFLKYITEQQSARVENKHEPAIGVDAYRKLLETFDANGYGDSAFRKAVHELPWYQRFDEFAYLDSNRKDRTSSETILGNFWLACYLKDFGVEVPDRRFDFMEDEEMATWDQIFGTGGVSTLEALNIATTRTLSSNDSVTLNSGSGSVPHFGARVYKVDVDSQVDTLNVDFEAASGFTRPIVQVVLVEPGSAVSSPKDQVRDIIRSDRKSFDRTIANDRGGTDLDHVAIVVAGSDTGGSYSLSVSEVSPAPDVTITPWHTAKGEHYEIDPKDWQWTWVSPDIWVDNNNDGKADDEVYFGQNNDLHIRLRNQGHAAASGISVDLSYQNAAGGLSPSAWKPVKDASGTAQQLTNLSLGAESTNDWSVNWAPQQSGTSNHYCVRAVVTAPGDPNTDNKRVLSNFGNVVTASPYADLPLVRRHDLTGSQSRIDVVPRAGGRWEVSTSDVEHAEGTEVPPEGETVDEFRVRRLADFERTTGHPEVAEEYSSATPCGIGRIELDERTPDPDGDYPTDPASLPPGVEGSDLVTITHVEDGVPIGGFTWAIREVEEERERPR